MWGILIAISITYSASAQDAPRYDLEMDNTIATNTVLKDQRPIGSPTPSLQQNPYPCLMCEPGFGRGRFIPSQRIEVKETKLIAHQVQSLERTSWRRESYLVRIGSDGQ
ncbi:MAG TPA: hypothetical protein DCE41_37895 [Cytophagales bacterium]|nr:hypothetical protein [Cytophagales bacterium]